MAFFKKITRIKTVQKNKENQVAFALITIKFENTL